MCYNVTGMGTLARAHLIIEGRVQGVFFRAFTREVGANLKLQGWVRNRPDGSVEAVFEGPKESVESAIARCRMGPPGSRVDNISEKWEEYSGEFNTFTIRY